MPFACLRSRFILPASLRVDDSHVRLRHRKPSAGRFLGVDVGTLLDGPDELDVVFPSGERIDADFFRPIGGSAAENPLEVPVLGFQHLERARGPVLGQVAEHHEVIRGHDLGFELGIGLLEPLQADLLGLLVAFAGGQLGDFGPANLVGAGRIRLAMGFFGSLPASSVAPSLTQRSILAIAASESCRVRPLWHARLDFALDPQHQRALVRDFPANTTLWSGVPASSFSKVDRSSLPRLQADAVAAVTTRAVRNQDRRDILRERQFPRVSRSSSSKPSCPSPSSRPSWSCSCRWWWPFSWRFSHACGCPKACRRRQGIEGTG